MARIPVANDPRSVPGGKAGRALGVLFLLSLLYFVPVAVVQSIGGDGLAQRDVLDGGEVPAEPLSTLTSILVFAGIPLAILVGVTVLTLLPDLVRGPRYRPARGWSGGATWFAGPPDAERAVQEARSGGRTKGGARGSW